MKLCECGCGQPAPLAPHSDKRRGWVKGEPLRFVRGHNCVPGRHQFSSTECAAGGSRKRGYRYSEEHKERIREAKRSRGYEGPFGGKRHSVAAKDRMRTIAITKQFGSNFPNKTDEESANWKGGKEQYQKRKALKRDDYTCQVCGLRDPEIAMVDHIKPRAIFPEGRESLENLQTLCPNCHARKTKSDRKAIAQLKRRRA